MRNYSLLGTPFKTWQKEKRIKHESFHPVWKHWFRRVDLENRIIIKNSKNGGKIFLILCFSTILTHHNECLFFASWNDILLDSKIVWKPAQLKRFTKDFMVLSRSEPNFAESIALGSSWTSWCFNSQVIYYGLKTLLQDGFTVMNWLQQFNNSCYIIKTHKNRRIFT